MASITTAVLRDELREIDGKPFSRFLVYELVVPLPVAEFGTPLFSVAEHFTINMITVKTTQRTRSDSSYLLVDFTDSELIGVLQVRPGVAGLRPIAAADLRADLRGPCTVLIQHSGGQPLQSGALVVQLTVTGPAGTAAGVNADLNQDGIPDDLEGLTVAQPATDTGDDFFAGYQQGRQGIAI